MSEPNKLKPCPRCGGECRTLYDDNVPFSEWIVECTECFLSSMYLNTEQEATDWWNDRIDYASVIREMIQDLRHARTTAEVQKAVVRGEMALSMETITRETNSQ